MAGRALALTVALWACSVPAASATTILHVNGATGSDALGNNCQSTPCKTIENAVVQGRLVPDIVTIQVAPGTYDDDLALGAADSGLTITGAGSGGDPASNTVIAGSNPQATIDATTAGSATSLSLSHLRILNPPADTAPAIVSNSTELALSDVAVDVQGNGEGIQTAADATIAGGSITIEGASTGPAVVGPGAWTISGTPITTNSAGSPAIQGGAGPINLQNSPVTLSNAGNTAAAAIVGTTGAITLQGSPIDVNGTGGALQAGSAPVSLSNLAVTLENAANGSTAIQMNGRGSVLSRVTIGGAWSGRAVRDTGSLLIADSTINSGAAATLPLLDLLDGGPSGGSDVAIVRSTVHQQSTTQHAVVTSNDNVVVDSSLVLGGDVGVLFQASGGSARALTLASSTVDAGTLGTRDTATAASLTATAANTAGSAAIVNVQGSILVEAPAASRGGANGTSTVNCIETEVPGTTQTAGPTEGTITCGSGSNGNAFTSSLSAIFANSSTGYALNPSWSGLDSVPESAIALPVPFSDSATDRLGNPRVVNGVGTCEPGIRDRGAIELTGHGGIVPAPAIAAPASVLPGVAATFTGSAANAPAGVPLTFTWRSSDGATGTGATFTHTFVHPGSYTLSLTVSAAAGCSAGRSVSVPVHGLDVITALKVTPNVFRAAASGTSITSGGRPRNGTTISYRGTEAATTTFTVQLGRAGRIRGGTCRLVTGKHPTGKRCTVFLSVGAFSHTDLPGSVSFHFTGRLLGRKLPAGSYRLRGVPTDPVGKGATVFAGFKIKT
jgi:hypothetical protein